MMTPDEIPSFYYPYHWAKDIDEALQAKCLLLGIRILQAYPDHLFKILTSNGSVWKIVPDPRDTWPTQHPTFTSAQEAFDAYVKHITQRSNEV